MLLFLCGSMQGCVAHSVANRFTLSSISQWKNIPGLCHYLQRCQQILRESEWAQYFIPHLNSSLASEVSLDMVRNIFHDIPQGPHGENLSPSKLSSVQVVVPSTWVTLSRDYTCPSTIYMCNWISGQALLPTWYGSLSTGSGFLWDYWLGLL